MHTRTRSHFPALLMDEYVEPTTHPTQLRSVVAVPSVSKPWPMPHERHAAHDDDAAPEYIPEGHALHVLAARGANVPAEHSTHAALPLTAAVPGSHVVQEPAPSAAYVPAAHGVVVALPSHE